MIEPAAYGAAVLFGPHVWNFRDTAKRMLDAQAAIQVADESALESAIRTLSVNSTERTRLGAAASQLVLAQQGATERTMRVLAILIAKNEPTNRAA
jgi:3-deoxy-D-manno-octulosonic-acid transferase